MRDPVGCTKQDAFKYLGCTESMFDELCASHKVKRLRRNWFLYTDLDDAAELLKRERDQSDGVIQLEKTEGKPTKGRNMGSKGSGSYKGRTQELLRGNG